ncbi:MAG: sulfotransferase, partial [Phycisphaerae bacterium]
MAKDPVFLVGAERSGTTLARLMLDHHPRIAWLNEFEYAVDLIGPQGWPDVNAYCDYLETNRIFA